MKSTMPLAPAFCAFPLPTKRWRPFTAPPHLTPRCAATPDQPAQPAQPDRSLQKKVESHLLDSEQRSDLIPPASHPPAALPVQLDLLNYHARVASRRRSTRPTAHRLYRRCISLNSADGRAWLGLARLRLADGDVTAARRTFRAGVSASRGNAHLLQAWGVLEERQGNPARAKGLYEAAVRADPAHCAAWVALGLWYRRFQNDVSEARNAFKQGAEADPNNYYVWHVWGMLERDCRRLPVARECFRRGVEANPNNAATYVAWGSLEDLLGNYNAAIDLFKRAHVASPRNTHAYVSHAVAAERGGDIAEAVSLLQTAIAIRPSDPAPRQTLGLVAFRSGDADSARAHFQAALDVDEKHGPTWHAWACVEQKLGQLDRARELFQEAIWAGPQSPHVVRTWHSWGMMELDDNNFEAARRNFAHGLEVDPTCIPLLTAAAKLEASVGNMPRARECMEKCIRLQPTLRSTWEKYEDLEREFGSAQRAQLVYERCVVTSKQVDARLIVSEALPGDFAAGGMWIDPLELSPTESAFKSMQDVGNFVPQGKTTAESADADEGITSSVRPDVPGKVTVSRRSSNRKRVTRKRSRSRVPRASNETLGPQGMPVVVRKPSFPPNLPFMPTML